MEKLYTINPFNRLSRHRYRGSFYVAHRSDDATLALKDIYSKEVIEDLNVIKEYYTSNKTINNKKDTVTKFIYIKEIFSPISNSKALYFQLISADLKDRVTKQDKHKTLYEVVICADENKVITSDGDVYEAREYFNQIENLYRHIKNNRLDFSNVVAPLESVKLLKKHLSVIRFNNVGSKLSLVQPETLADFVLAAIKPLETVRAASSHKYDSLGVNKINKKQLMDLYEKEASKMFKNNITTKAFANTTKGITIAEEKESVWIIRTFSVIDANEPEKKVIANIKTKIEKVGYKILHDYKHEADIDFVETSRICIDKDGEVLTISNSTKDFNPTAVDTSVLSYSEVTMFNIDKLKPYSKRQEYLLGKASYIKELSDKYNYHDNMDIFIKLMKSNLIYSLTEHGFDTLVNLTISTMIRNRKVAFSKEGINHHSMHLIDVLNSKLRLFDKDLNLLTSAPVKKLFKHSVSVLNFVAKHQEQLYNMSFNILDELAQIKNGLSLKAAEELKVLKWLLHLDGVEPTVASRLFLAISNNSESKNCFEYISYLSGLKDKSPSSSLGYGNSYLTMYLEILEFVNQFDIKMKIGCIEMNSIESLHLFVNNIRENILIRDDYKKKDIDFRKLSKQVNKTQKLTRGYEISIPEEYELFIPKNIQEIMSLLLATHNLDVSYSLLNNVGLGFIKDVESEEFVKVAFIGSESNVSVKGNIF